MSKLSSSLTVFQILLKFPFDVLESLQLCQVTIHAKCYLVMLCVRTVASAVAL